jgi:hypothetical protein
MLTATIGQISAASSLAAVDLLEAEIGGVSKKIDVGMVGDALTATSVQSAAGSSNDVFITPATLRAGLNAENAPPIYACRAWVAFNGTTTSSALTGTYTRVVGTTQTVCVATAHGFITGNIAYVDFTSGGASDNSYLVTVINEDSFTVNTVSTSSILTSAFTLPRCPVLGAGNVSNISRVSSGLYYVNFMSLMPSRFYSAVVGGQKDDTSTDANFKSTIGNTTYPTAAGYFQLNTAYGTTAGGGAGIDFPYLTAAVFA